MNSQLKKIIERSSQNEAKAKLRKALVQFDTCNFTTNLNFFREAWSGHLHGFSKDHGIVRYEVKTPGENIEIEDIKNV